MSIARAALKGATAKLESSKAGIKTFHKAYKAAPAQTLGHYAKTHRIGTALTVATLGPSPIVAYQKHQLRQMQAGTPRKSTHVGIDAK